MLQIPHDFFKKEAPKENIELPDAGDYAVGMIFLPKEPNIRLFCEGIFEKVLRDENQKLLGWRQFPVNEKACGESARATRPVVIQVFIHRNGQSEDKFQQNLLIVREQAQNLILNSNKPNTVNFYIASLSESTIVYKGLVLGYRLDEFYLDLQDESIKTAIALVHERYSSNTSSALPLPISKRHTPGLTGAGVCLYKYLSSSVSSESAFRYSSISAFLTAPIFFPSLVKSRSCSSRLSFFIRSTALIRSGVQSSKPTIDRILVIPITPIKSNISASRKTADSKLLPEAA
jgi:hypothetical protein